MTDPSSHFQPQTPPAFTLFLESVYLLTNAGYLLSAKNGGGVITDDAIQTQDKYSLGKGTDPFVDNVGSYLFNVFQSKSSG